MTIHFDANNYSHNIGCYQFYVLPGYINNILLFFCWPKHHFTFYCLANASLFSKVQNVLINCFKPPNEANHLSIFHKFDDQYSLWFFFLLPTDEYWHQKVKFWYFVEWPQMMASDSPYACFEKGIVIFNLIIYIWHQNKFS